jgi:hypothetical protein
MAPQVGKALGLFGTEQAPTAPDMARLAQMTSNSNKLTDTNPYGTTGWSLRPGADPNNPQAGDWVRSTALSTGQQSLYDQGVANKLTTGLAAGQMAAGLGDTQTMADALYGRATQFLQPQFDRDQASLETKLQNQGLTQGSEAYNNALGDFNRNKSQTYESAAMDAIKGSDTAQSNATSRIAQLLAATQETVPQSTALGGGVDYTGAANANYKNQLDSYNADQAQKAQQQQQMMQMAQLGLMAFSDRRLKSDVERVGEQSGLPVYEYTIFNRRERGFMADEVQACYPEAVFPHSSGYLMVDYAQLGGRP